MKAFIGLLLAGATVFGACASLPSRTGKLAGDGDVTFDPEIAYAGYTLGPDDIVQITVEQHPEWSGEYTIRPDGTIYIKGLGQFRLENYSKYEAAQMLSGYLVKYIVEPKVTVDIVKALSQVIYILGEVNKPGKYRTEGKNLTLRDAIVLANLPARFAATSRVYVLHPGQGRAKQQVINLDRILYRGELKNNIRLRAGDIVYVPQNFLGAINNFFSAILSPLTTARSAMITP